MPELELTIDVAREDDGRWLGQVEQLPGVQVYGRSPEDAEQRARSLAYALLADEVERGLRASPGQVRFRVRQLR